jgi:rhamnulokinase
MPVNVYLAIDVGASGGRHILGWLDGGRIGLEEVRRFPNGMTGQNGSLCWDIEALVGEVKAGIIDCARRGISPRSVAVDTWGVDFVLLDKEDKPAGPATAYRDGRTKGMDAEAERLLPYSEHYARTGTRKEPFNTVYQLMALKLNNPEILERAETMLLMPDYLHWRLTGEKRAEYTIASTTGLINALSKDWDFDIIDRLGFPRRIFLPVKHNCVPGHDTANAFLAAGADEHTAILNSGTWSLLGVNTDRPVLTGAAREAGFTNEGGYAGRYRFLKTIMGMWMIESIRRELPEELPYGELEKPARESSYGGTVDVGDPAFYAPESMTAAVRQKCVEAGYPAPDGLGGLLRCVCRSLAKEYARSVKELAALTGRRFNSIVVTGGGSRNEFLNELTAAESGLEVRAGPAEGTALGNIMAQMLNNGESIHDPN